MNILITNLMMLADEQRFAKILSDKGYTPIFRRPKQFFSEEECLELVGEIDGWLAGDDVITPEVMDKALPQLKVISKWGTGLDSIDLAAAKDKNIKIANSPGAFKDAVAEIALGFMLELARGIGKTHQQVQQGQWPKTASIGLMHKTLGLIGYGAIGQAIAKRAHAFKMQVNFFDNFVRPDATDPSKQIDELDHLLETSDYICLCCNLTTDNFHLINRETLAKVKKDSFIINVARGGLINQTDLTDALLAQEIAGAGLDVFETEPLDHNDPLLQMNNIVLGSHNANNVVSVVEAVHQNTLDNLFNNLAPTS